MRARATKACVNNSDYLHEPGRGETARSARGFAGSWISMGCDAHLRYLALLSTDCLAALTLSLPAGPSFASSPEAEPSP